MAEPMHSKAHCRDHPINTEQSQSEPIIAEPIITENPATKIESHPTKTTVMERVEDRAILKGASRLDVSWQLGNVVEWNLPNSMDAASFRYNDATPKWFSHKFNGRD